MSWIDNMCINIFPMALDIVVLLSNRPKYRKTRTAGIFNFVIIFDFLIMLTDVIGMAVIQEISGLPASVIWLINVTRLMLTTSVTTAWFIYVCYRLRIDVRRRWLVVAAWIAAGLADTVILLTPYRHLSAYGLANADNVMKWCYIGVSIFGRFMFTFSGIAAVCCMIKEKDNDIRRECIYFIVFSIIPIVGIELQNYNQQLRTASACVSITILYVYVSMQNKHVVTDGLTGANNRREFDAYLERRSRQQSQEDWGLLMIDVDDFKIINDKVGHKVGDDALWNVADILRSELKSANAFIARYGGDEFVVCADWDSRECIERIEEQIEQRVQLFNEEKERGYKLSLSIGAAMWSESGKSVEELLKAADKNMYEVKQLRKERRKADCECSGIYTG